MPLTVITMKNVPKSLRGELSKWMQEIATGVFVGNFNTRIREALWSRIKETVGDGEATISYPFKNELGYQIETVHTNQKIIDYEGLPLVLYEHIQSTDSNRNLGFSKASKFLKAKRMQKRRREVEFPHGYIVLDIETTGLDEKIDKIIEIGAVKIIGEYEETFHKMILIQEDLPSSIQKLTGISKEMLIQSGIYITDAITKLVEFIEEYPIVGYGVDFDLRFLSQECRRNHLTFFSNRTLDLKKYVKLEKPFLANYTLQTVLSAYRIDTIQPHRALEDAILIYELSRKVNTFQDFLKRDH